MKGLIALLGSGEYLPVMDEVDEFLLSRSRLNGQTPRVVCLPTAAGREGQASVERWSKMGIEHFKRLDADVVALPIIDKSSANDPQWLPLIENANLVYFSGGDPYYLHHTLQDTRTWEAALAAWDHGAAYAGCSAGAMILAARIPNIRALRSNTVRAFNIIPATYIIPHYDAIPGLWKPALTALRRNLKKDEMMLGIDENTALVGKLYDDWRVMGQSKVHVLRNDGERTYQRGESIPVNGLTSLSP